MNAQNTYPKSPTVSSFQVTMEIRLCDPAAKMPYKKRKTDAGYDISSIETIVLPPQTATVVHTGICLSAPPGFYYTIEGRSSLWSKGIFPNCGIIDATFCGPVIVSLVNVSDAEYQIMAGDRIAQILIHRQYDAAFNVVEEFSATYNQRGNEGFGSTGR